MILGPMKIHMLRADGEFSYQTILLVQNKWTFIHMLIVHLFETNSTIWYKNSTALQSVWKQTPILFISTAVLFLIYRTSKVFMQERLSFVGPSLCYMTHIYILTHIIWHVSQHTVWDTMVVGTRHQNMRVYM